MVMPTDPAHTKAASAPGTHSWFNWDIQSLPWRAYLQVGWVTLLEIGDSLYFHWILLRGEWKSSRAGKLQWLHVVKEVGKRHMRKCQQVCIIGSIPTCLTIVEFFVLVPPVGHSIPGVQEQSTSPSSRKRSNNNVLKSLAMVWRSSWFFCGEWPILHYQSFIL